MKKRVFAVILGSVMAVSLMACGTKDEGAKDGTKTYTVGISQFAEHGSLDNCREGFIEGLKEAGFEEGKNLEIKEENAAANQGTAKQISDGFVSDDVDLICGRYIVDAKLMLGVFSLPTFDDVELGVEEEDEEKLRKTLESLKLIRE